MHSVAITTKPALPIAYSSLAHGNLWIGTTELATVAGITSRKARAAAFRCFNGATWRGCTLNVRSVGGVGGKGGTALQVYIPSLPAELRAIWHKHNPGALVTPAVAPLQLPGPAIIDLRIGDQVAEMKWKRAIVAPALLQPKGSTARAAILANIAARTHQGLNGKPVQFAVDTLRDWLGIIEAGNEARLARQRRSDAGKARWHINGEWDKACPLPDTEKRMIAAALEEHIRGGHRNLTPASKIDALASAKLQQLAKDAGWIDAPLIRPGLYVVRKFASSRLPGIQEKDARLFHDKYRPSIHRSRPRFPMDCVFGDVHPDDILVSREDGSEATARMIAWFDMASHDVFYTLVLLPKGRSITQADIIASLIAMVEAWGLPKRLYLDNGSEYMNKDFIRGLEMLQGLCSSFSLHLVGADDLDSMAGFETDSPDDEPKRTVRARPYNARAKVIEAFFSWLNKFVSLIPGYIGGDRMRKKTHNVGRKPKPFPGTFEQLRDGAYAEAVAFYRNEPQGGTMGGKSVNQFKREAYADPAYTPPPAADAQTLLAAFATVHRKPVQHGGIKFIADGKEYWYWDDELIGVMGEKIDVHRASWKLEFILWIKPDGVAVLIRQDVSYDPFDTSGAKEQSRREGLLKRHVSAIRKISPVTDPVADMARFNDANPPPPVAPIGPRILLGAKTQAIADAVREAANTPERPPEKLPHLAYREKNGAVILPARIEAAPEPERFDIFSQPPPQKTKTDASADAPVFDIHAALAKKPPLNNHEKETESP